MIKKVENLPQDQTLKNKYWKIILILFKFSEFGKEKLKSNSEQYVQTVAKRAVCVIVMHLLLHVIFIFQVSVCTDKQRAAVVLLFRFCLPK